MHFKPLSFALVVATLSCFGCDNKNTSDPTTSPSASAAPSTAASYTTAMSAPLSMLSAMLPSTTPSASSDSTSAAATNSAPAVAAPSTAKIAASAAPSASAAPVTCGSKDNPCPLQAWMKQNANPAVSSGDAAQIGAALDQIVKFAPPGYTNWAKIATDGSAAAKSGDVSAAKGACRSCHDQYKAKYKAEMRDRKI